MSNESQNVKSVAPDNGVWVGYHVVCVIDLLGQKAKLAQWAKPPPDLQPTREFVEAIRDTAGRVLNFREMFEKWFHDLEKPGVPQERIDALLPDQKTAYLRARECQLSVQQFSDTFLFYSPIQNSAEDVSIIPLYHMLAACCLAMTYSLAEGMPLRGAVCIGMGMELADQHFYGPALAEAHFLEDEVAQYPRIMVSPEATRFAQGSAGFSQHAGVEVAMKELATACRTLLCEDLDGQVIVDFLVPFPKRFYDFCLA